MALIKPQNKAVLAQQLRPASLSLEAMLQDKRKYKQAKRDVQHAVRRRQRAAQFWFWTTHFVMTGPEWLCVETLTAKASL